MTLGGSNKTKMWAWWLQDRYDPYKMACAILICAFGAFAIPCGSLVLAVSVARKKKKITDFQTYKPTALATVNRLSFSWLGGKTFFNEVKIYFAFIFSESYAWTWNRGRKSTFGASNRYLKELIVKFPVITICYIHVSVLHEFYINISPCL